MGRPLTSVLGRSCLKRFNPSQTLQNLCQVDKMCLAGNTFRESDLRNGKFNDRKLR